MAKKKVIKTRYSAIEIPRTMGEIINMSTDELGILAVHVNTELRRRSTTFDKVLTELIIK